MRVARKLLKSRFKGNESMKMLKVAISDIYYLMMWRFDTIWGHVPLY